MNLSKFLAEECTSWCMDNEEDRAMLNDQFQEFINRGLNGIESLHTNNVITDSELDAAITLLEFVLRFANTLKLPTLSAWAASEYTSLTSIHYNRNLVKSLQGYKLENVRR